MVFGLAHEAQRSKTYRNRLAWCAQESSRHTILDNGADELGEGLYGEELYSLAEEIRPNELILPDVLGDANKTMDRSLEYWENWIQREDGHKSQLMGVVQGLTFEEWIRCYDYFSAWEAIDTIGVIYDVEFDIPGSDTSGQTSKTQQWSLRRPQLIQWLHRHRDVSKPMHLLGTSNLWELAYLRDHCPHMRVRSCDTTAPFAAASADVLWSGDQFVEKDWSRLDFSVSWDLKAERIAQLNLYDFITACGDTAAAMRLGAVVGDITV